MEGEQDEVEGEEGMQDFMSTEQVDEETQTLAAGLASKSSDELSKALHEMLQVLGTPRGGKVLVQYVLASPRCVELLSAWEAGSGAPTAVPLMLLLCEMFRHPAGKGEGAVSPTGRSLDSARKKHKASSIVQVGFKCASRACCCNCSFMFNELGMSDLNSPQAQYNMTLGFA